MWPAGPAHTSSCRDGSHRPGGRRSPRSSPTVGTRASGLGGARPGAQASPCAGPGVTDVPTWHTAGTQPPEEPGGSEEGRTRLLRSLLSTPWSRHATPVISRSPQARQHQRGLRDLHAVPHLVTVRRKSWVCVTDVSQTHSSIGASVQSSSRVTESLQGRPDGTTGATQDMTCSTAYFTCNSSQGRGDPAPPKTEPPSSHRRAFCEPHPELCVLWGCDSTQDTPGDPRMQLGAAGQKREVHRKPSSHP